MEYAVRRFARNILLLHLGLLAVVLAVVLFASREIERGARDQAIRQFDRRQELLANQTARGIQEFYELILNDMDLLPREDEPDALGRLMPLIREPSNRGPPGGREPGGRDLGGREPGGRDPGGREPGDRPFRSGPGTRPSTAPRGTLLAVLLARQLEERVSHLFIVDRNTMAPREIVIQPKAGEGPTPAEIVARYDAWLRALENQAVSRFELFPAGGLNLVCLSMPRNRAVLVAAVPVSKINERFLRPLNSNPDTAASLVHESMTVMVASRPSLIGMDLTHVTDPELRSAMGKFAAAGFHGSRVFPKPFKIGSESFQPALVTAEAVELAAGKKWLLLIASPLSEIDGVVATLFGKVTLWALFVTAAVTAILVSTSLQLIRGRVRLERVRHEVLRKELERARQIQQSWLPRHPPTSDAIDVAAVNYPANHISGDFYNWFDLPDGRVVVVIGDVTGHGMSAAFLMATTQLLVSAIMKSQKVVDPGRCMAEVNRQLCEQVYSGQFVTMQILVLDAEAGHVDLATAGHPAPLLSTDDEPGVYRPLPVEPQLVLGVESDATYETVRFDLPPGSALLLYTDGVCDVQDPRGGRLGSDGLKHSLPVRRVTSQSLLDSVLLAVNNFRAGRDIGDDLTLVAVYLRAAPVRPEPAAALATAR